MAQQQTQSQNKSSKQKQPAKQQQAPPKENTTDAMARPDIEGWGADLDKANRPAVPMERTPPRFMNVHWTEIEQQPVKMKVFHSVERPGITPIFGTSSQPRGLSGVIRTLAYKSTENDIRHWLLLLFADRVDMVEGIIDDLKRGYVPNIFAEMGIKSEWKYNKAGLIRKVAITAGVIGLASYFLIGRRSRNQGNLNSQWAAGSEI